MSAVKKSPASEQRIKAAPAVQPEAKPTPRERLKEAASWQHDYLYLDAVEGINEVLSVVFDVIDAAVAAGTMTMNEHGRHGARAGGAATRAIEQLMTMRTGDRDMSSLLYSIAEELPAGSEAAK